MSWFFATSTYYSRESKNPSCVPCPNGFSCYLGLATLCPVGAYCPPMTTTPIDCPKNTYNMEEGATDVDACLPCSPTDYSPPGSYGCFKCPDGKDCSSGMPVSCSKGAWCKDNVKTLCPKGTASSTIGASSIATCLKCDNGGYSFMNGATTCYACKDGYLCDEATGVASDCGEGGYCVGNVRYPCPVNTFASAPVTIECGACPFGTTAPEGSTKCTPVQCDTTEGYTGTPGACVCSAGYSGTVQYSGVNVLSGCSQCPSNAWSTSGNGNTCAPIACPAPAYTGVAGQCVCATGYGHYWSNGIGDGGVYYKDGTVNGCVAVAFYQTSTVTLTPTPNRLR